MVNEKIWGRTVEGMTGLAVGLTVTGITQVQGAEGAPVEYWNIAENRPM